MTKVLVVDDVDKWRNFNSSAACAVLGDEIMIDTAESAASAYNMVLQNISEPYDIIITDMQMEDDYAPKYAGEWLVEQIKTVPQYTKTKIVMISASYNINYVADNLGVLYIPKSAAIKSVEYFEECLLGKLKQM